MPLALRQPDGPPVADLQHFADLAEVAQVLSMSQGHLRRLCDQIQHKQLAAMMRSPEGGRPQWYIARAYHPGLARGAIGIANREPDVSHLTKAQQAAMYARRDCVVALRQAREARPGLMRDWLPDLVGELQQRFAGVITISRSTLLRWDKVYGGPKDLLLLADSRGGRRNGEADPAAWDALKDLLASDQRMPLRQAWRLVRDMARQHNWHWPSYDQVRRQMPQHLPPHIMAANREPDAFRRQFAPFIEQHREKWAAGECWVGDHRQMNLWCTWGPRKKLLRPWLTAWLDWRSRRVVGWTLAPKPTSSTILAAFRHGLLDPVNAGGPDHVWVDNGKDYSAYVFHGSTKQQRRRRQTMSVDVEIAGGLFRGCGVEPHFSLAYNPNGKARIERFFDTVESFDQSFATYCGRNPGDKPELLQQVLDKAIEIPTFDHVFSRLADWIKGRNAMPPAERDSDHLVEQLDGLSPDEYLTTNLQRRRALPPPHTLDLLLQHWHKPVTLHRNGVSIIIAGVKRSYGATAPELRPLKPGKDLKGNTVPGQEVLVCYDPRDLSRVRVLRMDGSFVCEAPANHVSAHDESELREAIAEKRRYQNAVKVRRKLRAHEFMSAEEAYAQTLRQDRADQPTPAHDLPTKIVPSMFEVASEDLRKQRDRRKAAGSEDHEPLDLSGFGGGIAALASIAPRRDFDDDEPLQLNLTTAVGDDGDDDTDVLDLGRPTEAADDASGGHILDALK
jgi:transposase InsO family protein